jgi:hypothetical protein
LRYSVRLPNLTSLEHIVRAHLLDPTEGNVKLGDAVALGREIYDLYEAGQDYSETVARLGLIAGHPIHDFAVRSSFGSVKPETFARRQLVSWDNLPADVTEQEMLEMVERIDKAKGDELQLEYWIACLRVNTGDAKISDLIFWPGSYFGDGDNARVMSPSEILVTALKAGGKPTEA